MANEGLAADGGHVKSQRAPPTRVSTPNSPQVALENDTMSTADTVTKRGVDFHWAFPRVAVVPAQATLHSPARGDHALSCKI